MQTNVTHTTRPVCPVPSDWPEQVIRCQYCGFPITPDVCGWSHGADVGPLCPPYLVAGVLKQTSASPSAAVAEVIRRAVAAITAAGVGLA